MQHLLSSKDMSSAIMCVCVLQVCLCGFKKDENQHSPIIMHVCWVHWPWHEPTASAEVPLRTLFEWFLSWSPTGLNYYLPFPPLPRFLPPSLLIPHHSFSLERPVLSPLLSFSGVLLWSARTAGEPLTTVCVFVCVCEGGWAEAVVCPRSSNSPSFSLTFAVFLLFLPSVQTQLFFSSPWPDLLLLPFYIIQCFCS